MVGSVTSELLRNYYLFFFFSSSFLFFLLFFFFFFLLIFFLFLFFLFLLLLLLLLLLILLLLFLLLRPLLLLLILLTLACIAILFHASLSTAILSKPESSFFPDPPWHHPPILNLCLPILLTATGLFCITPFTAISLCVLYNMPNPSYSTVYAYIYIYIYIYILLSLHTAYWILCSSHEDQILSKLLVPHKVVQHACSRSLFEANRSLSFSFSLSFCGKNSRMLRSRFLIFQHILE